jgi:hypothetical protein
MLILNRERTGEGRGTVVTTGYAAPLGTRLDRWMQIVGEAGLDGWLIADFRGTNPIRRRTSRRGNLGRSEQSARWSSGPRLASLSVDDQENRRAHPVVIE